MNGPSFSIAVALHSEQVAIERIEIDARPYRSARLEQLIVGTGSSTGQILRGVDRLGAGDGGLDNVVHRSDAKPGIEPITQEFDDTPIGAVTQ